MKKLLVFVIWIPTPDFLGANLRLLLYGDIFVIQTSESIRNNILLPVVARSFNLWSTLATLSLPKRGHHFNHITEINPYKPDVLFLGHMQTASPQMRCHVLLRLILGYTMGKSNCQIWVKIRRVDDLFQYNLLKF